MAYYGPTPASDKATCVTFWRLPVEQERPDAWRSILSVCPRTTLRTNLDFGIFIGSSMRLKVVNFADCCPNRFVGAYTYGVDID